MFPLQATADAAAKEQARIAAAVEAQVATRVAALMGTPPQDVLNIPKQPTPAPTTKFREQKETKEVSVTCCKGNTDTVPGQYPGPGLNPGKTELM